METKIGFAGENNAGQVIDKAMKILGGVNEGSKVEVPVNIKGLPELALEALNKPFTDSEIRQRKLPDGTVLDYIEGYKVIDRLNKAFGSKWSFYVLTQLKDAIVVDSSGVPADIVVVGAIVYQLVNGEVIRKENVGTKKIKFPDAKLTKQTDGTEVIEKSRNPEDIGNDYKAAVTDALKKCATLFGVGLDLYRDDTEVAPGFKPPVSYGQKVTHDPAPSAQAPIKSPIDTTKKITAMQLGALKKLITSKGLKEDAICAEYKVSKLEDMLSDDARKTILSIQSK